MGNKGIPLGLVKAIKENNLVLFVGAGLSCNFENKNGQKLGTWRNLARQIIENDTDLTCLKPLVDEYEPIFLLDLIEKRGDETKNKAIAFAKDFFHLPADKNDYNLHKKLCRLSHKIITTNYDNVFVRADEDFTTRTATIGKNYELNGLHKFSEKTLLKLHGCITDGEKMVLFPSNYTDLYDSNNEDAERILFYLQNLITNKTILFIGCGMGDFQINNIFSKVRNLLGKFNTNTHYIIAKETKLDSKLDKNKKDGGFLDLISIDNYSEIENIIDELLKIKEERDEGKIDYEKQMKELQEKLENTTDGMKLFSIKHEIKGLEFDDLNEYDKAAECFEIATQFDSENDSAFNNWGLVLFNLAKIKQDEVEKEKLFALAFEKLEQATIINDKNDSAFYNWGCVLFDLAKIKQDEKEKEKLFELTCEKLEKATIINNKNDSAFYNWGCVLFNLAKIKQDEKLILKGIEKCKIAYQLNPLENSYNLACGYALIKNKKEALYYLEETLKNKGGEIDYILNDEDWKDYLSDKDFINLIEKYK